MRIDLTCPVEMWRYELPTGEFPACGLMLYNLSDRIVSSVEVTLILKDKTGEELERIRLFFSEERTEITVSFWGAMWDEEIAGSYHGETVIVDGKEFVDMQFGAWAEMTYTEDGDTVQVEVTYHDEIRGSMTLTRTAADQYTVSGISGTVIDETITGAIRVGSVFTWKE